MKSSWLVAGVVLLVLGLAALVLIRGQDARDPAAARRSPQREAHAPSTGPRKDAPSDPVPSNENEIMETSVATAADPVAAAEAEVDAAVAAFRAAELELDDLEREVDAVARFVDDLEEKGEDPARHAEEGMKLLGPVIERYEARLALVDSAEEREAAARSRLEQARAEALSRSTP